MLPRRVFLAIPAAMMALAGAMNEAAAQPSSVSACTALAEDGQRLRAAGKLIDARDKLMACSVAECPQVVRVDCAQWASEVLAATPTIVVDAKDADGSDIADAKVFVDDRLVADRVDGRPIPVDPGSRVIRIERAGGGAGSQSIVAKENTKGREVKISLAGSQAVDSRASRAQPSNGAWGWQHFVGAGLVAVGAIGVTYATVSFLSYKSEEDSLVDKFNDAERAARGCASDSSPETTCGKNIATREALRAAYNANEKEAQDDKPLHLAGLIGGTLLIAGGLTMFLATPRTKSSSSVRGGPVVTPHFAGMTLGGTF